MFSRSVILILVLISVATQASAQTVAREELRGVKFGMSAQAVGATQKVGTRAGVVYKKRPGEKLAYRGVALERVLYGFENDRLVAIELWTKRVGPSFTFLCEDKAPNAKLLESKVETEFTYEGTTDTLGLLHHDPKAVELADMCDSTDAYDCLAVDFWRQPKKDDPKDTQLLVSVASAYWARQRTREEFSAAEIKKIEQMMSGARPTEAIALDVYHCQHVVRIRPGDTRATLDARQKSREELFKKIQ